MCKHVRLVVRHAYFMVHQTDRVKACFMCSMLGCKCAAKPATGQQLGVDVMGLKLLAQVVASVLLLLASCCLAALHQCWT